MNAKHKEEMNQIQKDIDNNRRQSVLYDPAKMRELAPEGREKVDNTLALANADSKDLSAFKDRSKLDSANKRDDEEMERYLREKKLAD